MQDPSPCHKMHHQATKRPEKGLTDRANHQIACRRKKSALRGQRRCHPQHETPFSHQFCVRQRPSSRLIHGVGSGPAHFYQKLLPKKLSPFICFTILVDCDCYTSIIYTLFKTKISYTARLWVVFLHGQDELLRAISLRADLLSEGGGGGSVCRGWQRTPRACEETSSRTCQ